MCSQCRMEVPGGARVCPFCRGDRWDEGRREDEAAGRVIVFFVSAFLVGLPACVLWYWSSLGTAYRGAFWLIFPVAGVVGYRLVVRNLGPALCLVVAYLLAGGYYLFWFDPDRRHRTKDEVHEIQWEVRGKPAQALVDRWGQPDARLPRDGGGERWEWRANWTRADRSADMTSDGNIVYAMRVEGQEVR